MIFLKITILKFYKMEQSKKLNQEFKNSSPKILERINELNALIKLKNSKN